MKKAIAVLLVLLISISTFSFLSTTPRVSAQSDDQWPNFDVTGDSKVNLDDTIKYVKDHYSGYNKETGEYRWDFTDPYDIAMANYFMQSVLYVEYVRDSNDDKTVFEAASKLLTIFIDGISLDNFDGTKTLVNDPKSFVKFMIKNFLVNQKNLTDAFNVLFRTAEPVSKIVDLLRNAGLTDVKIGELQVTVVDYLVDNGEEWLSVLETDVSWVTLKFDSATADATKYPLLAEVADVFRIAMTIYDFANVLSEHIMNVIQMGTANIMETVQKHEIAVEFLRGTIEVVGKLAKELGGAPIKSAYIQGLITTCVPLAVFGGPPGIVAAAIIGAAGVAFYFAVDDIVDKAIEWAADETLGLDLAIYKKLSTSPKEVYIPLYQIEVRSVNTQDEDNFIPWGPGCTGEDIYVVVRNTGVRTLNLRVEPEISSTDPDTGETGWNIDDKQWWDFDNWLEKENLKPGEYAWTDFCFHVESGTVEHHFPWPFSSINDVWVPGENPGLMDFNFHHDWLTEWWDIFDLIGGLKYIDSKMGYFYNNVDLLITVHGGPHIKNGETIHRVVDVKNMLDHKIDFTPEVHLIDPLNEVDEYDPQISIEPSGSISVMPSEVSSFTVSWTAPEDAPSGFYSIAINAKDKMGNRYLDNLAYEAIFFLYKLEIIFPTTTSVAKAGDPSNPSPIFVYVTGLPPLEENPAFSVRIPPPVFAQNVEIVDTLPVPAGYTLKVIPPIQASEGKYDLEIGAYFGPYYSMDTEPNAVEYALAPSTEPIEKGLAWLRTSQYGDGSWQGSVGVTALCALAFLNAGYDETDTDVNQAIQYIVSRVHGDGSIYGNYYSREYETSMAVLALVATHNDAHKTRIDNARNWLVNSQWDESCYWGSVSKSHSYYGGFGYGYNVRPDLSNTQFALLALDAAGLPKDDPTWVKAQVFLHRCQKVNFPITLNIEGTPYTVQPWNYAGTTGGYDGGFLYLPGTNPYVGGAPSMGSMTGAGIWGLLLSGVPKSDQRVTEAINWVIDHYTWDTNPNCAGYRRYYYYLSMAKALTMYGEKIIGGHDWYQELYNKITDPTEMIAVGIDKAKWVPLTYEDYVPDLSTAYAILSLQTRAAAPPVQRLSYLTFILRSNCLLRILDSEGNLVGYNYMTGLGENNIPTAIYSGPFSDSQYIVIVNPEPGTYKLELIGISEGPYELTIQGNYGEEATDTFEYTGDIKPAELHGSDLTVTAVVGPLDIYANPPEFEEIIDNIPPTTTLEIGEPKYVDPMDNIYVTSATPFTLTAEDNPGGTGVASIFYRIYNSPYDTGWLEYSAPFYLTGPSDGEYSIDYYSTDTIGNTEPTRTISITLDNSGPLITIENPPPGWALQDRVTFIALSTDPSGTHCLNFSIREANGDQGIPVGFEDIPATYNATTGRWNWSFNTLQLPDGFYIVLVSAEDNLGHTASILVPYSIRNWAVLELLPATPNNKAGRTMPVKFALRVAASVDPNQPFVYNEELTIKIYATDNPSNILQTSTFGDTARDYRINTLSEQYITNFQTLKTPKTYMVEIWRKNMLIGSFQFKTVK